MPELVQALRSIGENNITDKEETRIKQLFVETPETHDSIRFIIGTCMDATSYQERNKSMNRWIDFSLDEKKAMIQGVVEARPENKAITEESLYHYGS